MHVWHYEPEDNLWSYVTRKGALFIEQVSETEYIEYFDTKDGRTLFVITISAEELSNRFKLSCFT